jgi:hypothetical protein
MIENGHKVSPESINALFETTVPLGNKSTGRKGLLSELITGTHSVGFVGKAFRSSNL